MRIDLPFRIPPLGLAIVALLSCANTAGATHMRPDMMSPGGDRPARPHEPPRRPAPSSPDGQPDHQRALSGVRDGALPALRTLLARSGLLKKGRLLDVKLIGIDGRMAYLVVLLDSMDHVRTYSVDLATGAASLEQE